jgi:hypothetical protein
MFNRMKAIKIFIGVLVICLAISSGNAQIKFNTMYGNQYTCVYYYMLPGYECILRSPKDSFFINATNYIELGNSSVILDKYGNMVTSNVQNADYSVVNYTPYFAKVKINPYGSTLIPLCGQITHYPHSIIWQSYLTSCIGKNGKVYLGGIQAMNDSLPFTVQQQTVHYSTIGYMNNVNRLAAPGNGMRYFSLGYNNNRCVKIIPDNWQLCMLGEIDGYNKNGVSITSKFEPAEGTSKFIDSAFYIMKVDTLGTKKACKFYQPTGGPFFSDAMNGIVRDSIFGFITSGHLKLTIGSDKMHIVRVDSNLNVLKSFALRRGTLYTEGTAIIKGSGSYIALGNYKDSSGNWTPFLVSFNPTNLRINWAYSYPLSIAGVGSRTNARAWNIIKTSSSDLVIIGTSDVGLFLLRTDQNGNRLWGKGYGGQRGYSVVETSDQGLAAAGDHYRCTPGLQDLSIYCVRTDLYGNANCSTIQFSTPLHNGISLTRDTMALDTNGTMYAGVIRPDKDCKLGGYMEQYTVCPECCFDPYDKVVKMLDTNAHCIGDTFYITGKHTEKYRFEWYVNGQLYSRDTMIKYVFKAEGPYYFDIRIILKTNPNCVLKGCAQAFILPGNKGFNYIKIPTDTVQLAYNDTLGNNEYYWKWQFDDGYSVTAYNSTATYAQKFPKHRLSIGLHKVCLTVRTGTPDTFCESTVCEDICIGDPTHDCCSTCP